MKTRHFFHYFATLGILLAGALTAAGQSGPFQLEVVGDDDGAAVLLESTQPGFRYELESTDSLADQSWATLLGMTGFGQAIQVHVVDIEPPSGWPGGNPPPPLPRFSCSISPFPAPHNGNTLVGFIVGGAPVQVLVAQDWFALTQANPPLPPFFSIKLPDDINPTSELFIHTHALPWPDITRTSPTKPAPAR